jgi:hypothetical protein
MKLLIAIIFISPSVLSAAPFNGCKQDQFVVERIFIPSKLGPAKSDARETEMRPVEAAIETFVKTHSHWKFTQIHIISSSANTPIQKPRTLNPLEVEHFNKINKSSNKNLAETRAGFAKNILHKIKSNNLSLSGVELVTSNEVLGPQYVYSSDPRKHDQNLKLVVPEFSKDFDVRVLEIFNENKKDYEKVGITNAEQLFNKEEFKSLYDVKFKAFQGYTLFLHGKTTSSVGCGSIVKPAALRPATSKQ